MIKSSSFHTYKYARLSPQNWVGRDFSGLKLIVLYKYREQILEKKTT